MAEQVRIWNIRDSIQGLEPYVLILEKSVAPGRSVVIPKATYERVASLLAKIPGLHIGPTLPKDYQKDKGMISARIPKTHVRTHGRNALAPEPAPTKSGLSFSTNFVFEE